MQSTIDLSAGLVPANNSQPTQSIDLSAGMVPASQPSDQQPSALSRIGGFLHDLVLGTPEEQANAGTGKDMVGEKVFSPQGRNDALAPGLETGAEKGLTETLSGTSQLAQKGIEKLTGEQSSGKGVFGEAPATATETEANGAGEFTGKAIENVMEFMAGDEALKGLSVGEKLKKMGTVAKFIEDHPFMAKLIGSSAKNAAIAGAQTAAHGGDFTSGAETGAVAGPVGETVGAGLSKLGSSISDSIANNSTKAAADEFGVPLTMGQQTGGNVAQATEAALQKVPFISDFKNLATDQNTAIQKAAGDIADSIATSAGSATESGENIQNAITEAKTAAGKAYDAAQKQIANSGAAQLPVPLQGTIADTAKRLLDDIELPDEFSTGVKDVQGRQGAVDVLKNLSQAAADDGTPRSMTWEQARRLKSALRDMASSGDSNVGKGALKQMTAAIDDSMQKTLADSGNTDLAQQFRQASNRYRAVNDAMDTSVIKRLMNRDPIEVGKFLLDNATPNSIQTLKGVAGSQMPHVQRGIWEEMFNRALSNPDGVVAGKVLQKEFQKLGPETAQAVWNPQQLQKIQRFVSLVGKTGLASGKNSIGNIAAMSAAGGAGAAELATHPSALKGVLIHAPSLGVMWVSAKMLARFMTSPTGPETLSHVLSGASGTARSRAAVALVNYLANQHAANARNSQ
jgi:hypothetical protein